MVFFRYDDIPGVIGKVGTLFGKNGVNIANMAVSRTRDGQQALMALSVDEPPSDALIEEMHSVGFGDAIFIDPPEPPPEPRGRAADRAGS